MSAHDAQPDAGVVRPPTASKHAAVCRSETRAAGPMSFTGHMRHWPTCCALILGMFVCLVGGMVVMGFVAARRGRTAESC